MSTERHTAAQRSSSSRTFLSGEEDPELLRKRLARLTMMPPARAVDETNKKNDNVTERKRDPLIKYAREEPFSEDHVLKGSNKSPRIKQVAGESSDDGNDNADCATQSSISWDGSNTNHDEITPPPLFCPKENPPPLSNFGSQGIAFGNFGDGAVSHQGRVASSTIIEPSKPNGAFEEDNDPATRSLMEAMVAEGEKARAEKIRLQQKSERQKSKTSFGNGMKKGFLTSKKKKPRKSKNRTTVSSEKIANLRDNNKNLNDVGSGDYEDYSCPPPLKPLQEVVKQGFRKSTIPLLKPKDEQGCEANEHSDLRLDEVQEAMRNENRILHELEKGDWVTPEFVKRIADNPRLVAGLTDPRFAEALKDPRKAMKGNNKEIKDYLTELFSVLGEHFTKVGEANKSAGTSGNNNDDVGKQEVVDAKRLGPFVEEAVKMRQSAKKKKTTKIPASSSNTYKKIISRSTETKNREEEEDKRRVQKIIENKELTKLLMDPDFQEVMKECGVPGRMNYFMQHPEYGPKLRTLMEAGLLKIEH